MQSKVLIITMVAIICTLYFAVGTDGAAISLSENEPEVRVHSTGADISLSENESAVRVHRYVRANNMFNVQSVFSARDAPNVDWDSSKRS